MHRAAQNTKTTLAVLSDNYLNAAYTQSEWAVAFRQDPQGQERTLIPIRVSDCQPTGLLGPIVYVDLVNQPGPEARKLLLEALKERTKPDQAPPFPVKSADRVAPNRAAFPGMLWTVPYERNPFFTGRDHVLADLRQQLTQGKRAAITQTQAISGLGGIGKTQTAVEYAYRHRQDYQAVFWVRAETKTELFTGINDIARTLELPQTDAQDPNQTLTAVKHWLEQHPNWLLIFDNADTPDLLEAYRPQSDTGHILLTSRAQVFDRLGIVQPLPLAEMQPQEAVDFLFNRTHCNRDDPQEQEAAHQLTSELGYLPLALEQAGAYILSKHTQLQTYLSSYRQRQLALLEQSRPVSGKYPTSVATTWDLNFQQVEEESPAAADLLRASAFLSPDAIPYELLQLGAEHLGERITAALTGVDQDPLLLEELLSPLGRYSLIRQEAEQKTYSIYRLVQEVVKDKLDTDSHRLWAERTLCAVTEAFPDAEYDNWPQCDRLLAHAQVVITAIQDYAFEFESVAFLLNQTGYYLNERSRYSEAEILLVQSLKLRKRLLSEEHPDVAQSLNSLATLYNNQGRYSEAEPLLVQALELRQRLLGEEHPDVVTTLNNLAILYANLGRYSEVEMLLVQTLRLRKRLLGEDHLDVVQSLNNLAMFYEKQKCYSEAEPLLVQALELYKRLQGEEHPDGATILNNLAMLYDNQGRHSEAEPLYVQALEMRKRLLGMEHSSVALSLNNLAYHYYAQGCYSEAEPLYVQVLEMRKHLLGMEHPSVALSLNNLAKLYYVQGNYIEAEPLYRQALELMESLLGKGHPHTEQVRQNFDACLQRRLNSPL